MKEATHEFGHQRGGQFSLRAILSLGAVAILCQIGFPGGGLWNSAETAWGQTESQDGEDEGWEVEIHASDDHEGHDHGDHEGHDHEGHDHGDHEEHEPGVVHLTEQSRENFGITVQVIEPGDFTLTLDLYGWIRPRPQDVKVIRSPFPAIVTHIFAWPGEFVSEKAPLVSLIIPEQLDWIQTIDSSENEIRRLNRQAELLREEGHAKAIELIGRLEVAVAQLNKLQVELDLLSQVGSGGISKREVEVKRGEVAVAKANVVSLRSIARTYGFTSEEIAKLETDQTGEEIKKISHDVMPTEIRSQLDVIEFGIQKAVIDAEIAKARLTILDMTGQRKDPSLADGDSTMKGTFGIQSEVPSLVTEVMITPPVPVTTEDPIMRVVDYRTVYIEVEVPEIDMDKILSRPSDEVPIRVSGLSDELLTGTVAYFDTQVRADERMAHLFIEVENVEGMLLRDGMAATVGIPIETRKNTLSVPKESVLTDGTERVLFVQEGEDFRRVPVRTGITTLDSIEILEGLEPGQSVAVSGVLPLLLALQQQEGRSEAGGHSHAH